MRDNDFRHGRKCCAAMVLEVCMTEVHIAGCPVQVGTRVRQRCSWCGATLIDCDLARMMVPVGQDPYPAPPTWEPGAVIAVDGAASYVYDHEDGAELPAEACAYIDPAVTK